MSRLVGKDPDAGKDWRQKKKRVTEDELFRQQYQFNGREFQEIPLDNGGLRSLVGYSTWGRRVRHDLATEQP